MFPIGLHLGLRQVFMALMLWAINVPQELLQSEARLFYRIVSNIFVRYYYFSILEV